MGTLVSVVSLQTYSVATIRSSAASFDEVREWYTQKEEIAEPYDRRQAPLGKVGRKEDCVPPV